MRLACSPLLGYCGVPLPPGTDISASATVLSLSIATAVCWVVMRCIFADIRFILMDRVCVSTGQRSRRV